MPIFTQEEYQKILKENQILKETVAQEVAEKYTAYKRITELKQQSKK